MAGYVGLDGRLAWLSNGSCRYDEALRAAEEGLGYADDLGLVAWSLVELIEAAVRSGQMEKALSAFEMLREATCGGASDLARGITARCQALVSSGIRAEAMYLEAIDRLGRTALPIERARAHLLYGEWLRRSGRRVDARRELRLAAETFEAMGVEGFAQRSRRELLATGETVRKRSIDTHEELTPQEAEITRLAGSGYTNAEIGLKLFIGERTVEWHLRKVFAKLGVTSRRQLRDRARQDELDFHLAPA